MYALRQMYGNAGWLVVDTLTLAENHGKRLFRGGCVLCQPTNQLEKQGN